MAKNRTARITKLEDVEKAINEIWEALPKKEQPGDVKLVQNSTDNSSFEVLTENGWTRPYIGNNEVILKPLKDGAISGNEKKSIDEIEAEDLESEDTKAKETIYDDKASKFILPRPDYESEWLTGTQAVTTVITHNLDLTTLPSLIQWFISDTENPVIGTNFIIANYNILNENWGVIVELEDKDTIRFHIGHDGGIYHPGDNYFGDLSIPNYFRNGYFKIKIWK